MKKIAVAISVAGFLLIAAPPAPGDWTEQTVDPHPVARGYHAMAYIGDDKALLFGGIGSIKYDDTWVYDLSEGAWTQITPPIKPLPRSYHDMAYLGGDQVLLFGGHDGTNNKTWVFDLSEGAWTEIDPPNKPIGRYGHVMSYIGGDQAVMFSGYTYSEPYPYGGWLEDTWVFDLSEENWTQISPPASPAYRAYSKMAYIGGDQALMSHGWWFLDDTWVFDLSEGAWTQLFPAATPSGRHWLAMAANGASNRLLMFAGCIAHPCSLTDQTWVYDVGANTWIEQSSPAKPLPRREAVMADLGGDRILMFGGRDNCDEPAGYLDDTWIYDLDEGAPPAAIDDLMATLAGSTIHLSWTAIAQDTLGNPLSGPDYIIYRNASPTFSPGPADSIGATADTFFVDPAPAVKDTSVNHTYVVHVADSTGRKSEDSNRAGEYDFALAATAGTDHSWIGTPLSDPAIAMAGDLEAAIEANSSPTVDCLTVSQWNPASQTYTHYITVPVPSGDFALAPGQPCRVETDTGGIFTFTGAVPAAGSISFSLTTTTGTDYTWISLPLELDSLAMASDLEAHIENHSDPATDCLTVSRWNPAAQTYTHYTTVPIPSGDFALRTGRPYRVEVTADALWPSAFSASACYPPPQLMPSTTGPSSRPR